MLCFTDGIVELLVAVVGLRPSLCESIQVETLLGAYHATTTKAGKSKSHHIGTQLCSFKNLFIGGGTCSAGQ